MRCEAKSCPSANKLSKKNASKRTYVKEEVRRSSSPGISTVKIAQRRSCASHAVIPRVKGRNRKRGRDERVYAYRAFYNFAGWIGIKRCSCARYLRAEWLHDKSSERESRDELTASRNKGAAICDSAFSFIPKRDVYGVREMYITVNNRR